MIKDVVYRCIGDDFDEGVLACGYMPKPTAKSSQHNFLIGYYSCFILLSGSGTYSDGIYGSISLTPGSFVQRLPGRVHTTEIHPDGKWAEFFISFGHSVYETMNRLNLLPKSPVTSSAFDLSALSPLDAVLRRLKYGRESDFPYILADMTKIVLRLCETKHKPQDDLHIPLVIEEACHILESDLAAKMDMPQVARRLNMSYENFRKLFTRHKGMAPGSYRRQQRIRQASLMLRSGISIKETAALAGYADTYSFTREFTKTLGISPGKYQKL